jgi:polysaccharide biosynthesis/export protein
MRRLGGIALTILALSCAAAAAGAQTAANYVIGPQDVLNITVYDQGGLSNKYAVDSDGTFTFPLIGAVKVNGMTVREVEVMLIKRLADGYLRNPQVSVSIDQYRSKRVFVMGDVRTPGTYQLTGDMSLIEAIARAGSTTPTASGEILIVRSRTKKGPVLPGEDDKAEVINVSLPDLQAGRMSQNVALQDGDTIYVQRADSVYVFGQVRSPGAYAVPKTTTVLQALSLAGGVTELAAMNRIKIVRVEKGERKEIKVKLTDLVRANDTIIVPERYF